MQKTRFYQLNKPQLSDFANIEEAINPSMDIIDSKLKELSDSKISSTDGAIADVNLPAAWAESVTISDLNQIEAKRSIKGILSALIAGLKFVHTFFKQTRTIKVSAAGFSNTAPYTLRVVVSGMKATDTPVISHFLPSNITDVGVIKASWKAYSCIDKIETDDGGILIKCFRKKPTQDIWLMVKGG